MLADKPTLRNQENQAPTEREFLEAQVESFQREAAKLDGIMEVGAKILAARKLSKDLQVSDIVSQLIKLSQKDFSFHSLIVTIVQAQEKILRCLGQ